MGEVRVGISGWRYAPWRGTFYPPGLPQRSELEHASALLTTIEINGSFYSLQRPASYIGWAAGTPPGFVFSVKGGRYITHLLRLRGVEQAVANFFASGVLALGPKLGPILWQLPATFRFDPDLLEGFFELLPRSTVAAARLAQGHDARLDGRAHTATDADRPLRHVLEARHESFGAAPELMRRHGVGLVIADSAGRWPMFTDMTSDVVYVRLHGATELYVSGYDDALLRVWAQRVTSWAANADVFVYFDNDAKVHAPFDAQRLATMLDVGP